jgi:predicted ester cyclase
MTFSRRLALCALSLMIIVIPPSLAAENADRYHDLIRKNASTFHQNFSVGHFDANGSLVTPDVDVDSNNVKLVGRDRFVERIKRYDGPFPHLQLKDRIIIVDGNKAAVHYILQGEHNGRFGDIPATGHKIEAMSGEIYQFDDDALMNKLITITKLDDVAAEVKGAKKVNAFQQVSLLPIAKEPDAYVAKVREAASAFHRNFSAGEFGKNGALVATGVHVNSNDTMLTGRAKFVERIQRYKVAFPDMVIHDEYVLAEGNRAAVEYIMDGTQSGPFQMPDGSTLAPTGKKVHVRGIEFMEFDKDGLLTDLITISNSNDFIQQLTH